MRVLDTWSGLFVEVDPERKQFAILSHTWRKKEQTYDELKLVQADYGGPSDANDFTDSGTINAISHNDVLNQLKLSEKLPDQEYTFTPHGIRTTLPVLQLSRCLPQHILEQSSSYGLLSRWYLALLGCEHIDYPGALLGRACYIAPSNAGVEYLHYGCVNIEPSPTRGTQWPHLFPLSPAIIKRCRDDIQLKTVYVSHPKRNTIQRGTTLWEAHETINMLLEEATRNALLTQGYTTELRRPDEDRPSAHWLMLFHDDHTIAVESRHILEDAGWRLKIEAYVKMSQHAYDAAEEIEADPSCVRWMDRTGSLPWSLVLNMKEVVFTLATWKLTVKLGLKWAAPSHYFLLIEIVEEMLEATPAVLLEWEAKEERQIFRVDSKADVQDIEAEESGVGVLDADDNVLPGMPTQTPP
ncbi:hypothetical protein BD311DRAFT_796061 [Dichomitus squalens]|uniref:DUF8212 domain-containing protein n=1 Tax=Dichomitus squalens TaxID=114155 RepID=A0A4Q9MVM0_9APHY|nr:hypothetical protein BD311DRAFT_796061 [Dichomitus squalens]